MQPYQAMAIVYDALIEDVDYERWYKHFKGKLAAYGSNPYRVLEIGSGTGNMTEQLVASGMHVTALEPSEAMLSILQEKMGNDMGKIRFFHGSLADFKTKERFDGVFAFLDVFNYLSPSELNSGFEQVFGLLVPEGLFVLDVSSPYKLEHILGHQTFAENHDDFAFIWENAFDSKRQVLKFDFALFSELEDGTFERHVESHQQYAHGLGRLEKAASDAGFEILDVFGDDHQGVDSQTQRLHLYLKKKVEAL